MTDPVPGAGDDTTKQQAEVGTSPVAETTPAAADYSVADDTATGENGKDKSKEASHDDNSEAAETTEPDSDGEEEEDDDDGEEEDDEDEDDDEEPRLKYARLTQSLAGVYKNADATSSFLVAGDKMVWMLLVWSCAGLPVLFVLTPGPDRRYSQRQHQCHTAARFSVSSGIPCSLSFCDDGLDLSISTTVQHWQT